MVCSQGWQLVLDVSWEQSWDCPPEYIHAPPLPLLGWQLDSKKEHCKRKKIEPSSFLRAWPQKSQNVTSAMICWSKQLQAQQDLREGETSFTSQWRSGREGRG